MLTATTQPAVGAVSLSVRWISGRNFDLFFYIGACLSSYVLIYLNLGLGVSALLLRWFWILAVDGPHVFGTISRTYLDAEEWRSRRKLLLGSLLWFLVGPAFFGLSVLAGAPVPFLIFLVIAEFWAYWHVVRQHYGFLTLYQRKNGETAGKANPLDYWIFYLLMLGPFVSFLLRHPQAREMIGLSPNLHRFESIAVQVVHTILIAGAGLYIIKEISRWKQGGVFNLPKNLFLLACVPLHMLIFLHPYISTRVDIRLFAVFVTFYHNIQYHGIVWFYNRNRYGNDSNGARYGLAGKISRSFLTYYIAGVLFTLAYRYPNWFLLGSQVPLGTGPNAVSEAAIGSFFTVSDFALAFWWGFAFNHYYLDQKIWRVSKDRRLGTDLKL